MEMFYGYAAREWKISLIGTGKWLDVGSYVGELYYHMGEDESWY